MKKGRGHDIPLPAVYFEGHIFVYPLFTFVCIQHECQGIIVPVSVEHHKEQGGPLVFSEWGQYWVSANATNPFTGLGYERPVTY